MSSPAQRYAAARRRARGAPEDPTQRARTAVDAFAALLDFPLDDFQDEACQAVAAGRGVLVAAPTGAGKTVVGEFAVHEALVTGRKAFYTTPIKALSNQKYLDLVRRHGADKVGLLTGDSQVNGEAPVVVMTTEVLRNMMYAGSSTLDGLGYVVMDEVHYLADRFRGAVWEEVIIHLPQDVQVISLSATVSNAEEFGQWLGEVRGLSPAGERTAVVVSEHRPVPLWQHMMVGPRILDLFVDETTVGRATLNPEVTEAIRALERRQLGTDSGAGGRGGRGRSAPRGPGGGHGGRGMARTSRGGGGPTRAEVIDRLDRDGLLPAITFIFSRAGCDAAVGQLLTAGARLVPDAEGARIRRTVEERVAGIGDEDLAVLGYWDFVEGLERGFAAHHAGMLPTFREVVEELFTAGRIKAVFATETLALGINMPARTVVLERLVKFNGETHADVTPAEFTQLTGRAGRRGIDIEGHAVILFNRGLDPESVAGLASTRTYPLRSSFRPTYNMAVNLVDRVGRGPARDVLETSFAQFQADRAVVGMVRNLRRHEEGLSEYAEKMTCHLGDFGEYAGMREQIRTLEKQASLAQTAAQRVAAAQSLDRLDVGDVVVIGSGRRGGMAVVVEPSRDGRPPGPLVVTEDRRLRRLSTVEVQSPLEPIARVTVPKNFLARNPKARRDIASTMRAAVPHLPPAPRGARGGGHGQAEDQISALRRDLRAHPCHGCPDRENHARWAERWWRLERESASLRRTIEGRTNSVATTFDRICDLLTARGYLGPGGETVTPEGRRLQRLYTERDLLTAECLRRQTWRRLDGASLAAAVSMLVHEPRRDDDGEAVRMPNQWVEEAYAEMTAIWAELADVERQALLPNTAAPHPGIAWMIHRWAGGRRLEEVLRGSDMAAGDFVRRCKQVVDVLGQVADVAGDEVVARTARGAVDLVMRGVVAADRLD